jgi:hypothetical protein
MEELTGLRDQLKAGLSDKAPESGTPVAELAERIKALRAGNVVEAAPERARKAVRAERPVTARIRERVAVAEPEMAGQPEIGRSSENRQEVQIEQKTAGDAGMPLDYPPQSAPVEPPKPIELPRPIMPPVRKPDYRERVKQQARAMERQMRLF